MEENFRPVTSGLRSKKKRAVNPKLNLGTSPIALIFYRAENSRKVE
jgi:hypothetical protein